MNSPSNTVTENFDIFLEYFNKKGCDNLKRSICICYVLIPNKNNFFNYREKLLKLYSLTLNVFKF